MFTFPTNYIILGEKIANEEFANNLRKQCKLFYELVVTTFSNFQEVFSLISDFHKVACAKSEISDFTHVYNLLKYV